MSHETALATIDELVQRPLAVTDVAALRQALALRARYQLSLWDGAIIACAQQLNCTVLYSEDLSHGQDYDGVTVTNPFASL